MCISSAIHLFITEVMFRYRIQSLVIKNLQAENSETRRPIYKNPFRLKFEIGSYSWRSSK